MLGLKGGLSHFALATRLGDKAVQIIQTPIRFIILCLLMTSICLSKKPLNTYWVTVLWRKLGYHLWLNPILASAIFSAYVVYSEITLTCRPVPQEYICFVAFFMSFRENFWCMSNLWFRKMLTERCQCFLLLKVQKPDRDCASLKVFFRSGYRSLPRFVFRWAYSKKNLSLGHKGRIVLIRR